MQQFNSPEQNCRWSSDGAENLRIVLQAPWVVDSNETKKFRNCTGINENYRADYDSPFKC